MKAERTTQPDWRGQRNLLRVQRSALGPDDVVLLVDDWAETGSQAAAAKALIEECDAAYAGLSLLVDELPDGRRDEARTRPRRRLGKGAPSELSEPGFPNRQRLNRF